MDDGMLSDQRRLVSLVENDGWEVTDVELSAYESPWMDGDTPEATITITARKPYDTTDGEASGRGVKEGEGSDTDNPFRLK